MHTRRRFCLQWQKAKEIKGKNHIKPKIFDITLFKIIFLQPFLDFLSPFQFFLNNLSFEFKIKFYLKNLTYFTEKYQFRLLKLYKKNGLLFFKFMSSSRFQ